MLLNCVGVDCSMTLFLPANYTIYLSILQLLLIQTLPFSYPLFFFCEHLWALHFLETIQRATQIHGKANNVIKWYHYYVCFYKVWEILPTQHHYPISHSNIETSCSIGFATNLSSLCGCWKSSKNSKLRVILYSLSFSGNCPKYPLWPITQRFSTASATSTVREK